MKKLKNIPWKTLQIFFGGVLFGTAGLRVLSSKDAKKCYTNAIAAVLRAKSDVMKTVTVVRENYDDILTDAQQINEQRVTNEEEIVDSCDEESDETEV